MTAAVVQLFRRRCRVVVDTIEVVAIEADPSKALTVQFKVEKTLTPTPNKASVEIYNLNPSHRAQVESRADVPVSIEAGYDGGTSVLFVGKLQSAKSIPDGAGNIITTLATADRTAVAGQQKRISLSLKKGAPTDLALKELVKAIGVKEGNLADALVKVRANAIGQMLAGGTVLHGRAARIMTQVCRSAGLTWSVQDGKLQFLSLRQALAGQAILLTPQSGLIGTPTVDPKGVLKARSLLAPDVFPGRLVIINSKTLQGQFRIEKTSHTGNTRGQDWYVDIEGKRY